MYSNLPIYWMMSSIGENKCSVMRPALQSISWESCGILPDTMHERVRNVSYNSSCGMVNCLAC